MTGRHGRVPCASQRGRTFSSCRSSGLFLRPHERRAEVSRVLITSFHGFMSFGHLSAGVCASVWQALIYFLRKRSNVGRLAVAAGLLHHRFLRTQHSTRTTIAARRGGVDEGGLSLWPACSIHKSVFTSNTGTASSVRHCVGGSLSCQQLVVASLYAHPWRYHPLFPRLTRRGDIARGGVESLVVCGGRTLTFAR